MLWSCLRNMLSDSYPRAWGEPVVQAVVRSSSDDFRVDEELGFCPDGNGQHQLLRIEKRDTNTEWLARQLARVAGVSVRDIGFAGLKDRRAVTRQWFSIDLGGRAEPDWSVLASDQILILDVTRHRRKLRRGCLDGNRFRLTLREVQGELEIMERRLQCIAANGVPNYFGAQRFGRGGANIRHAYQMLCANDRVRGRHRRGIYLSAARSMLFNLVLAARVEKGSWREALQGEVLLLSGSRSFFVADHLTDDIRQRVASGDLLPSAPLWGSGKSPAQGMAASLEKEVLSTLEEWLIGLEAANLKQERRALIVRPREFSWRWLHKDVLVLDFFLPAGSYATALLHELVEEEAIFAPFGK